MNSETLMMLYNYLLASDEEFKLYALSCKDKTWQDIAKENNIKIPREKAD